MRFHQLIVVTLAFVVFPGSSFAQSLQNFEFKLDPADPVSRKRLEIIDACKLHADRYEQLELSYLVTMADERCRVNICRDSLLAETDQ